MSRKKAVGRRMRTLRVEVRGAPLPPLEETAAADAAFAASAFAADITLSTASSFASEMASARLDSLPSKVATMTKTRRGGGAGGRSDEEEAEEGGEEVEEASLACSKKASVPSRSTLLGRGGGEGREEKREG